MIVENLTKKIFNLKNSKNKRKFKKKTAICLRRIYSMRCSLRNSMSLIKKELLVIRKLN